MVGALAARATGTRGSGLPEFGWRQHHGPDRRRTRRRTVPTSAYVSTALGWVGSSRPFPRLQTTFVSAVVKLTAEIQLQTCCESSSTDCSLVLSCKKDNDDATWRAEI
jgi:hypothetical protein